MIIRTMLVSLSFCLGAASAIAADDTTTVTTGTGKHWAACQAEITKFCANIEKGKGKTRACLDEHTADLSDGCKASMAAHDAKAKEKGAQ